VDGEAELRRADLDPEPLEQFRQWYADAAAVVEAPNAMALATAASDGASIAIQRCGVKCSDSDQRPSARSNFARRVATTDSRHAMRTGFSKGSLLAA